MNKFTSGKASILAISTVFSLAAFFLGRTLSNVYAEGQWGNWYDTGSCVASQCGSSAGTKNQSRDFTERVCDKGCPTVTFTASHEIVDVAEHYDYADKVIDVAGYWACKSGYTEGTEPKWDWVHWRWYDWHYCQKDSNGNKYDFDDKKEWVETTYKCPVGYENNPGHSNCRKLIPATYTTETFTKTFQYDKSADPNHCHKPTPESLNIPTWARDDYGRLENELASIDDENSCHDVVTDTQTQQVSCVAEVVACPTNPPEPTPTLEPTPTPVFVFPSCSSLIGVNGSPHYDFGNPHQIIGEEVQRYGRDDVYALENGNYLQCFCPDEGNNGVQTNWLRTDDPIVGWFFENGSQWNLGNFMYAAQNLSFSCKPESTPTPTPTAVPTPTNSNDGGDGLGCAVNDCSGNPRGPAVLGTGTGGQVLGASTMATAGSFTENLYLAIMILGGTLSALGIKNYKRA